MQCNVSCIVQTGFSARNQIKVTTELNSAPPDAAAEVPGGDDEAEEVEEEAGRGEDVEVEEHGQAVRQEALRTQMQ